MAAYLALAVLVSLLAFAAASDHGEYSVSSSYSKSGAGANKLVVKVQGMVYCQSCAHRNSRNLQGATPLPGAEVLVTCRNQKNRVMAWRTAKTDGNGYYLADFGYGPPAAEYYEGNPAKACFVRLLSSPDRKCDDLTNINHGTEGAPIRDEDKSSRAYGYALFAPGWLAFRPRSCPPTHHY